MKNFKIFKSIDEEIFRLVSKLKAQNDFMQIETSFSHMDELHKEHIRRAMALSLFLIPLLIYFFISRTNKSLRNEIALKTETIAYASEVVGKRAHINSIGSRVLSPNTINDQSNMLSLITQELVALNISTSKIQSGNFTSDPQDNGVTISSLELKFNNFTENDLLSLFTVLTTKLKIRIGSLNFKKNEAMHILEGQMNLQHFSKGPAILEEDL